MSGYILILLLIVLVYVMLIRPRRRQLQAQQRQLETLEVGDEILTAGGIYGTLRGIDGDQLRLEIAPEIEIRVARRAVAAVLTDKRELDAPEVPEEEGEANLPGA
jgi:preprotein translocase subunit YajC